MPSYSEKAMEYFNQGYNCSQSVVAAFSDKLGIDLNTLLKLASSFGGGMGRLREVCGAVSGMFMVAGLLYGYSDQKDVKAKARHYSLIQDLALQFKEQSGSIICRELLGLEKGSDKPVPDERTKSYYAKRPCVQFVGMAAKIIEDLINKTEVNNENCNGM